MVKYEYSNKPNNEKYKRAYSKILKESSVLFFLIDFHSVYF